MAIRHVDDAAPYNGWPENTATQHYQCALIQADNLLDLEHDVNSGTMADLYTKETSVRFDDATAPAAHWWDGADSHFAIGQICGQSPVLRFSINPLSVQGK